MYLDPVFEVKVNKIKKVTVWRQSRELVVVQTTLQCLLVCQRLVNFGLKGKLVEHLVQIELVGCWRFAVELDEIVDE